MTIFFTARGALAAIGLAAFVCLPIPASAQETRSTPAATLAETVAAFRVSPLYRLSQIKPADLPVGEIPFRDLIDWLNAQTKASAVSNAPGIRIEVRPLEIDVPPHAPAMEQAIASQVERLRAGDATWREEIASNAMRKVSLQGSGLSTLEILKEACRQADLQYADDGKSIIIGNVYFLRWPPAMACRILPVADRLMKEFGNDVKNIIAPPQFHDSRRDWITVLPEQNATVVFHHPDMLDAMARSMEFANRNADELIRRHKPVKLPGQKTSPEP